ncbi:biotin--[acetyl-CoA-carboxylase] ligase [Maricaulis sp. D1M11]|uniref:biotin--[acetyl-CoA-carboxylase] ligase n=1 Tax=Maricaulis sp. D1M11 TaxID=3076117 RepID=UPI0039B53931
MLGPRLDWRDETASTNTDARALAEAGEQGPVWIAARRQTAGRGRLGRTWEEASGNLYCTGLYRLDCAPSEAANWSFIAALAVAELCDTAGADPAGTRLKWPNDVYIQGAKVAGILLESGPHPTGGLWMAVGIGVNLAIAPPVQGRRVTALADHGSNLTPEAGLTRLVDAFERYRRRWEMDGFDPIRTAWLSRAWSLGESCRASVNGVTVTGVFTDLLSNGALQLSLADGSSKTVSAGEVFFSDQE